MNKIHHGVFFGSITTLVHKYLAKKYTVYTIFNYWISKR